MIPELSSLMTALAAAALDLTDMATVDVVGLVAELAASDVLFAQFPAGDSILLKGEATLHRLIASGKPKPLRCMRLLLANDEQRHMLLAALELIEAGKMSPRAVIKLGHMLHSVQDSLDA